MTLRLRIFTLFIFGLSYLQIHAQTTGTLTFNCTTIAHSGYSGTKNVLAIWIQTNSGAFVKTYYRYAGGGTSDHLPTWAVNSGGTAGNCLATSCNVVGATTGATLNGAVTKTVTWNGTDLSGNQMPDGIYKVTIQETWNHGTSGTVTRSFSFTKGPASDIQTPTTDANFSNLSLQWIPALPVASFTYSGNNACVGQNFQLTSTSSGAPTSYQWTINGANPSTSTQQNPLVQFSTPGTYQVSLVASNANGVSAPSTQTIVVNNVPSITNSSGASICGFGSVNLTASCSSGQVDWYSSPTGGTSIGTGSPFASPAISATTTYYVEAVSNGCSSARTAVVATVTPGPTITASAGASNCGPGALDLSATPSNGTISWFTSAIGGSPIATGNTYNTGVISTSSTYYAEANIGACPSPRTAVIASILTVPTVNNPGSQTACAGQLTNVINFSGTNGAIFAWTNDNANLGLANSGNGTITPFTTTAAGTANITVTPTLAGCTGTSQTFTLMVNTLPFVTLNTFDTTCVSAPNFTLTGGSPAGGSFSGLGVNTANGTFSPSAMGVGVYSIHYTATVNGCSNQASQDIVVVSCAGLNEVNVARFLVYPNPSNGFITISGENTDEIEQIFVFDLAGKKVASFDYHGNNPVDLSELQNGTYQLKIIGSNFEEVLSIQLKK